MLLIRFEGFRDAEGFREVMARYEMRCEAADDVISLVVVGSMPRYDGEIRIVIRRVVRRNC